MTNPTKDALETVEHTPSLHLSSWSFELSGFNPINGRQLANVLDFHGRIVCRDIPKEDAEFIASTPTLADRVKELEEDNIALTEHVEVLTDLQVKAEAERDQLQQRVEVQTEALKSANGVLHAIQGRLKSMALKEPNKDRRIDLGNLAIAASNEEKRLFAALSQSRKEG